MSRGLARCPSELCARAIDFQNDTFMEHWRRDGTSLCYMSNQPLPEGVDKEVHD